MGTAIINLDEKIGKTVGSLPAGPVDYDRMVDAAGELMPRLPFPKGVYRFRSFEEADAWMEEKILQAALKKSQGRQS